MLNSSLLTPQPSKAAMKLLAKTTGEFSLYDPNTNDVVEQDRPSVVGMSAFISSRAGIGQLTIVATNLREEATDAEFHKFVKESESIDLAVASFLSKFGPDAEVIKDPSGDEAAKAAEAEAAAAAAALALAEKAAADAGLTPVKAKGK